MKDLPKLLELAQADVDAGFAAWLDGGLEEANASSKFGEWCVPGKLGLGGWLGIAVCPTRSAASKCKESCRAARLG